MTLMFEMLTPLLPIVIAQQTERLVLIGARHRVTGAEYDPVGVAERLGFQSAPHFPPVSSAEEALAAVRRLNASQHEGFVARDSQFRRVKIKAPGYVAAAMLRGGNVEQPKQRDDQGGARRRSHRRDGRVSRPHFRSTRRC
jgi:hypothetical protein